MTDERTWTLKDTGAWDSGFSVTGPQLRPKETVEVMPVAAHEAALAEAEEWADSSEHPNFEAGWHAGYARGVAAARRDHDECDR